MRFMEPATADPDEGVLVLIPLDCDDVSCASWRPRGPRFAGWQTGLSVAASVLLHGLLAAALCFAPRPQVPPRPPCIAIRLVSSLEGAGPGTLSGDEGDRPGEAEAAACPPPDQQPAAPVPVLIPPERPAPPVVEKKPPPPVPRKKRPEQKPISRNTARSKEEPAPEKSPQNFAGTSSEGAARTAQGKAPGDGAGTGRADGPGRGSGGGSEGIMEFGFGAPGAPSFLRKTMPSYPPFARKQQLEGTVLLRVTIDERGRAVKIELVKKAGYGFDEEAVKAIRESTFVPAKSGGKSLACCVLIPIRFELRDSDRD